MDNKPLSETSAEKKNLVLLLSSVLVVLLIGTIVAVLILFDGLWAPEETVSDNTGSGNNTEIIDETTLQKDLNDISANDFDDFDEDKIVDGEESTGTDTSEPVTQSDMESEVENIINEIEDLNADSDFNDFGDLSS